MELILLKKREIRRLRIDQDDWDYLTLLLNNLRLRDLSNQYAVNWTDDQTGYLTIYFEDGSIKALEDYGMKGTFGLSILFDFLLEQHKF